MRLGTDTQFPLLEFGVRITGQEPLKVISYRGANQPNNPVDYLFKMYTRIFENANLSDDELKKVLAERQSVLDFIKDDIARLQGRVSSEDKHKLEAHLGGIRNIEQRLQNSSNGCVPITMPEIRPARHGQVPRHRSFADGLDAARTQLRHHARQHVHVGQRRQLAILPVESASTKSITSFRTPAHDTAANEKLVKINAWHSEQVQYVAGRAQQSNRAGWQQHARQQLHPVGQRDWRWQLAHLQKHPLGADGLGGGLLQDGAADE